MTESSVENLQRSLSDVFFQRELADYRRQLEEEERSAEASLALATGIADEALIAHLTRIGIRVETLAALTLIPLIEVAWVDGVMDERERSAVLAGAESTGIAVGSPSHSLLRFWLEDRPPEDLTKAWREFIPALCAGLDGGERGHMAERILSRARTVAAAAGEQLDSRPSISATEGALLDDLEGCFEGS